MSSNIIQISDNFWNIRGSFKVAMVIDIGTQASLVKLANGKFVFLDSYTLSGSAQKKVDKLTNNGKDVAAVLNLHPFHTLHVEWMFEHYPKAKHYGTARHLAKFPDLDWQPTHTEDTETQALFAGDFEFSIPRGVEFISDDENIHFSSVLVFHPASNTIHVDDTLMYIRLPLLMRFFGLPNSFSFHPTLGRVLEKREGAVHDFRVWANQLADNWKNAENLCAAHTATLQTNEHDTSIRDRIIEALSKVENKLASHERKYG
ncbi:MAG: hypothetical protein WBN41_06845 [Lysobacterales bacterium]